MQINLANILIALVVGLVTFPVIMWVLWGLLMGKGSERSFKKALLVTLSLSGVTLVIGGILAGVLILTGGYIRTKLLVAAMVGWPTACKAYTSHVLEHDDASDFLIIVFYVATVGGVMYLLGQG